MHKRLQDNRQLVELIEANAPYWAAEAEIIRAYWTWPGRNRETERKWVFHQMYKEFWDGIVHYTSQFKRVSMAPSDQEQRLELKKLASTLAEEVDHYALFADLLLKLDSSSAGLDPMVLKQQGSWRENDELMRLRRAQIADSPILGRRASRLTEGGYVALFREGHNMPICTDIDRAISRTCGLILDDEFVHMLHGLVGMLDDQLPLHDLHMVKAFSVEQMKQRLLMRYVQFSQPITDQRLSRLLSGEADPIPFDYDRANKILLERLKR